MKLKRIVSSLMALAVTASCLLATGISVEAESTVTGITLNEPMGYFNVGTPLSFFTASVAPEGADAGELVWESDNPGIFTVDQQGVITGVSEGTATLTVRAGKASATATVNVVSNYSVDTNIQDTNMQYKNTDETPKITQADTNLYTGDYNTAIDSTPESRKIAYIVTRGENYWPVNAYLPMHSTFVEVTDDNEKYTVSVKNTSQHPAKLVLADLVILNAAEEYFELLDIKLNGVSVDISGWSQSSAGMRDNNQNNINSKVINIPKTTYDNWPALESDQSIEFEFKRTSIAPTPESRKIAYIETHSLYWPVNAYLPKHSASVDVTEDNKEYTVSVTNTSEQSAQLAQADLVILNAAEEDFELLYIKLNGDSFGISDWTQLEEYRPDNNNQWIQSKVIQIPAATVNTWPPLQSGKSIEFVFKRASEEPNAYVKFNTGAGTNGAQVRLKTDGSKNEDLRFKFSYDVTDLPEEAKVSEYGFIYASGKNFKVDSVGAVESLDLNTFTLSGKGSNQHVYKATAENYREEEKGRTVIYSNIVLTGIQDDELNIYYLARPYVTYTLGGETYTEYGGLIARSVYYVAKECYDHQLVAEGDKPYLLKRILNKVNDEEYPL